MASWRRIYQEAIDVLKAPRIRTLEFPEPTITVKAGMDMRVLHALHNMPSVISAVGATLLLFSWLANSALLERAADLNKDISNVKQDSYLIRFMASQGATINALKTALNVSNFPVYPGNESVAEDAQMQTDLMNNDRRRYMLLQDMKNACIYLHEEVNNSAFGPGGLLEIVDATGAKMQQIINAHDAVVPPFGGRKVDFASIRSLEDEKRYSSELSAYNNETIAILNGPVIDGLTHEFESDVDMFHANAESFQDSVLEKEKWGRVIVVMLFFVGTVLTIYGQWVSDKMADKMRASRRQ